MKYVSVIVDNNTDATDVLYTYKTELPEIAVGQKVTVPFSVHNRKTEGYVAQITEDVAGSLISFLTMEYWLLVPEMTFRGMVSGRIGSVSKDHFLYFGSSSSGSVSVTRCPTAQVTI